MLVPKPVKSNELRSMTKADMQRGDQNTAELYRICLDYREINNILVFLKQVQFTTLDKFLNTLKNKVVVSLDISLSFFIILIREDKHKMNFWVNDMAYDFYVLVMGLKLSLYHLKKFIDLVFSEKVYVQQIQKLSSS